MFGWLEVARATFIRDLFPRGEVYASLLSKEAQDVIGKVGAQTRGVERMLRRVGFRYAERIDPFDGGPHFVANADEVTLRSALPLTPSIVATTVAVPAASPDTTPEADTAAAPPSMRHAAALPAITCPAASRATAVA